MSEHESLRVELGARSYDILVGDLLLAQAGRHIAPVLALPRVVVVTDETVATLYLDELSRALGDAGIAVETVILPPGEQTKSFEYLAKLAEQILSQTVERGTTLVALGGGVVGDLTGFAASIVLRGIDFVQIPTTLLAQVDSSVGGKTGIDTPQGKNLVGSFHQPKLVLADTAVLSTLPRRQMLAGYAEVVKYGLINDPDFFTWLDSHGTAVIEGTPEAQRHAVVTSCTAKAGIVAADEREAGARALLNLGHTFAHALEAEAGYSNDLLHGEAVAIGLVMAFDLSVELGFCPAEDAARVRRHFAAVGLPTGVGSIPGRSWSVPGILAQMNRDKKVRDGRITFVLARGIGQAFLTRDVDLDDVATLLNQAIAA